MEEDSGGWYGQIFPDWVAWNTVRSYRATYLCLKDETYTDLHAV